jgi:hypothetical protein
MKTGMNISAISYNIKKSQKFISKKLERDTDRLVSRMASDVCT